VHEIRKRVDSISIERIAGVKWYNQPDPNNDTFNGGLGEKSEDAQMVMI